jgi:hypothetical protein
LRYPVIIHVDKVEQEISLEDGWIDHGFSNSGQSDILDSGGGSERLWVTNNVRGSRESRMFMVGLVSRDTMVKGDRGGGITVHMEAAADGASDARMRGLS